MNRAVLAVVVLVIAGGCGKMGNIRPPVIRTPRAIGDLRATQNAETVALSWTTPAQFIDGNPATDLAMIHIFRDGVEIASIPAGPAGQPQSHAVDVRNSLNTPQSFAVQVEPRRGKLSAVSSPLSIQPVDVPGPVEAVNGSVDQNRIRLDWQPPGRNGNLAESYIVKRSDQPAPKIVRGTTLEDREYEPGKVYTYTITAARGMDAGIPGIPGPSLNVPAEDSTKPQTPTELIIQPNAAGAFLRWKENTEEDLQGYWIYRSDRPDGGFERVNPAGLHSVNTFFPPDYRPGAYYAVSAVDTLGNESDRSQPVRGP